MSSCIVTIKNKNWMKREIMLYQYTDGHPNSMMLPLSETIREIYDEFKDHGDPDWFMDPSRVSGVLIVRSVTAMSEDVKNLLKSLPPSSRNAIESNIFLGMPALFPEVSKSFSPNYEYSIVLKEEIEDSITKFFGYAIEVYKLQSGRRLSTIMTNEENFITKNIIPLSNI